MAYNSNYTGTQVDEAIRKKLTPYQISTYLASPETGISLTGSTDNKVSIPVSTRGTINGFDIYDYGGSVTALRFIGSGLGNGDSSWFRVEVSASVEATAGAASFVFKAKTRPYTETDWANTDDVTGFSVNQYVANNAESAIPVIAPLVYLEDGDTLEISIQPDSSTTININSFGFKIVEL